MRFTGKLYRALNPVWAAAPLSGEGAAQHGGRFNARGTAVLYCSLSPHTALKEANQVGDLQPTTLVAYDAEIDQVFDGRDADALGQFGMTPAALADPSWRDAMKREGIAPTQAFAARLIDRGYMALLVPSYARGASATDVNLVLFSWGKVPPAKLVLIDEEGRLTRS